MADDVETTGFITGVAPQDWRAATTTELVSADGVLGIIATLERLDEPMELASFASLSEDRLFADVSFETCTETAVVPLIAALPTMARLATWRTGEEEFTSLILNAVSERWVVRCTASAPSDTFPERVNELVAMVSNLVFPFSEAVAAVAPQHVQQ